MKQDAHIQALQERLDAIASWLYENAPYTEIDQLHLDPHSPAQAYWHLGYSAALSDTIRMIRAQRSEYDSEDTSSPSHPNVPDV